MAEVLVLSVTKGKAYKAECNKLEDYYRELECDVLDIARRTIDGIPYDVFCDDMGLFKDKPKVSAVSESTGEPLLVGNLIFANHDDQGNTTSLDDNDVRTILGKIAVVGKFADGEIKDVWPVIKCEY